MSSELPALRTAVRTTRLRLAEPLRISRATMSSRDAVRLTVEQDGLRGHGEAVTSTYLGLDTRTLERLLSVAAARTARFPDAETALEALAERRYTGPSDGTPAAVTAAVESALLDLTGKRAGVPLHRMLGAGTPPTAQTARTIGITGTAHAADVARCLVQRGFHVLKVKAGSGDPEADLVRTRAVRRSAPNARLLLDPNGGWTTAQAGTLLARYAELGVDAVEQPLPPGDPESLARLAARSPVPVIADEDAVDEEDVRRLAGRVQGVNIKLAQCGGVHAARRIAESISGSGTELMLGCLTASSLGIAPAVHLADRARWVDLDGHLLLAHDPWTGIGGEDGTVRAPDRAGLGVRPAGPEEGTATAGAPEGGPRADVA